MAQHEREIISARIKGALAARKARGLPLGTPRDLSAYASAAGVAGRAVLAAKADSHSKSLCPAVRPVKRKRLTPAVDSGYSHVRKRRANSC